MLFPRDFDYTQEPQASPGGYEFASIRKTEGGTPFGVEGWVPPEQRVRSITFFLDGTAMVCDQRGQPVRGVDVNGKATYFALTPPVHHNPKPGYRAGQVVGGRQQYLKLATHAEVVAALAEERVDWEQLTWAGWPQLPYEQLKALQKPPLWPFAEGHVAGSPVGLSCTCVRCSVRDPELRAASLRYRKELEEQQVEEDARVDVVAE